MNSNFLKNLKIEEILIILFPFLIITGPAIPDISALLLILIFLYKIYKYKNFKIDNNYWIYIFFIMNLWFIFISFFSYNFNLSIVDSVIFVRFILFTIAITYFFQINENLFQNLLFSIFLATLFVTLDTLFQFYNYNNEDGFKGDIFGIIEVDLYGRLNGPFSDYIPGSYLSRLYFFLLIFLFYNKKFEENKSLSNSLIFFLGVILSTMFFTGEQMSVCTTLLGLCILFIFYKKFRKLVTFIILLSLIIISINKLFHPFYNDYKILENTSKHEGLIMERTFECKKDKTKICSKNFKKQPSMIIILKDFHNSPYGEIYNTAFQIWRDNKLTGIGLNNFEEVCKNLDRYNIYHKNYGCGSHPHNYYVQALVESVFLGLILFISLMIFLLYKFKDFKKNEFHIIGLIILLVIFWPIMSTGSFLKNGNMIFVSYLIGIIISMSSKVKKQ